MLNRKDQIMKEQIKSKLLSGVKLPIGNEPIKKEVLEKIIDNLVNEILEIKKTAVQSIYM
jgi:transcriptional regulator NrdR family protein